MPSLTTIANQAAADLGVQDAGGSLSTALLDQAREAANQILDNWSSEGKMALYELLTTFATVANTQGYTIGPAMTIAIARPARINGAEALLEAGSHMPIKVLQSVEEWMSIEDRNAISFTPRFLFYDRGSPTGNIYLAPIPRGCCNISIASWVALTQFANNTTSIALLPGYERCLRLALAYELAPKYDVPVSEALKENYAMALATVQGLNIQHLAPSAGIIRPSGFVGAVPPAAA